MKERTVPSGSNSYDLTGVGGDTAGCLLAARPSASTERVSCCWRQVERGRRALLPHFQRSENTRGRVPAFRGVGGALTFRPAWPNPVLAACLAAAGETGHPLVGEVSRGIEEGFGWTDLNILDGKRQISADAYLAPAAAPAGPELLRRRPRPRHDGRRSAAGASDRAGVRTRHVAGRRVSPGPDVDHEGLHPPSSANRSRGMPNDRSGDQLGLPGAAVEVSLNGSLAQCTHER